MQTPSIHLDEELVGEILDVTMPIQDLYVVSSSKWDGLVVPKDKVGRVISARAAAFGRERDGLVYLALGEDSYPADWEYFGELLRYAAEPTARRAIEIRRHELKSFGHIDHPSYFGEHPAPDLTPFGPVERLDRVCNGVCFVWVRKRWLLALCEALHGPFLPDFMKELGHVCGDFIFFDIEKDGMDFEALRNLCGSMSGLSDPALLEKALCARYPEYNDLVSSDPAARDES